MSGTDPIRRLLDAVLRPGNTSLEDMAEDALLSRFPFHRTLRARAGEPPIALRRRAALDARHLDPDPILWHRRKSGE